MNTHLYRLRLLPITALLACAVAGAAADKTAPEPTIDPVAEGKRVTFRLQSATYQIETNFDNDGTAQETETSLNLSLRIAWPSDINPVAVTDIRITEAVLDTGEIVVPGSFNKDRLSSHFSSNGSGENRYGYVQIPLAAPSKPFASIKKITGVVVLSVAGAAKEAELKPLSAFLGKSLALEGLGGAEITVERDKERGMSIAMPSDMQKRLAKVTFNTASGSEIETNGWGGGTSNNEYKQSYHVQVPDDGSMTVAFYGDLMTVESPLALSDIPMAAKPAAKEKTKVVLKTTTPKGDKQPEKVKVTPPKNGF